MTANTPAEVHELFAKLFSAGDIEGLLSLYEPDATLAPKGGTPVHGLDGIRAALTQFVASNPVMKLSVQRTIAGGDLALLLSSWSLIEVNSHGAVIQRSGQTSDVVRRQRDGSWRLVIDVPYGAEAANDS